MNTSTQSWQSHYTRKKSELSYPDENLVRMLAKYMNAIEDGSSLTALDLGCGSGRHIKLLNDFSVPLVIGIDNSGNALSITAKSYNNPLVRADNCNLPLKDDSVDIVVAWGSLHYNRKTELPVMLSEIHRVLKKRGRLFATLRSDRDTMLRKGTHLGDNVWQTDLSDISGAVVSFFSEDELAGYFQGFGSMQHGIAERTVPGDMGSLISHWLIHAVK